MRRKNLKISNISQNLVDANYIATFLGISLNALYLRMHFDNFPKALKINGKLFFDLNAVLAHIQNTQEKKSYAFLVQDEIKFLIEIGKLNRGDIGKILNAKNPDVAGGAVYLRPISIERAELLQSALEKQNIKFEIDASRSVYEQYNERLNYIIEVWEFICLAIDEKRVSYTDIAMFLNKDSNSRMGLALYKHGPSFKGAKVIKLKALQGGLL